MLNRGDNDVAVSDLIARFILEALDGADGYAVLQRGELAEQFDCVPSQNNYVISTRFSPERGYLVESRRGGGGYIRITRLRPEPGTLLMHMVNAVGGELDLQTAAAFVQNALDVGAVDPVSAANIRDILASYVSGGGSVIISSHVMDLVQRMCDHVAIIAQGQLLAAGTVAQVAAGVDLETRFIQLVGGDIQHQGLAWLRPS